MEESREERERRIMRRVRSGQEKRRELYNWTENKAYIVTCMTQYNKNGTIGERFGLL
jgi:hypothetical protein